MRDAEKDRASSSPHSSSSLLQWFRHDRPEDEISSPGEFYLPFLVAALEACVFEAILIGLAGINLLGSPSALLPIWGPPLVLLLAVWLFQRGLLLESSSPTPPNIEEDGEGPARALPGSGLLVVVMLLLTLCFIWLHLYSSTHFLLDPSWLGTFLGDVLTLNLAFYQALFILVCMICLCWRAIYLAQVRVEPAYVFRRLWVGLLIFVFAILFHANQTNPASQTDTLCLLLLLPIFLYFTLSAHALARVAWIRREHTRGLDGSTTTQERSLLSVITGIGLGLLVLTLLGGLFFNQAFFTGLQPVGQFIQAVYNALVSVFSLIFSLLATIIIVPFFWLSQWWFSTFPNTFPFINVPRDPHTKNPPVLSTIPPASPAVLLIAKIAVPLLLLLILFLLVRLALRRRKRLRKLQTRKSSQTHESLWSWHLFWSQVGTFLLHLWRRLFPEKHVIEERATAVEMIASPPVRTIRELYRTLLQSAASYGHVRRRDETPGEFQRRVDSYIPESEPHLGMITEAYTQTRYGGNVPVETELNLARSAWEKLAKIWEEARYR